MNNDCIIMNNDCIIIYGLLFTYYGNDINVTIPNSVTSIGNDAFEKCKSLQSITIQNSVTSIGEIAFEYCESLEKIYAPKGLNLDGTYYPFGCEIIRNSPKDLVIDIKITD